MTQLDLSKFPNILPEQRELQDRSVGLVTIREIMENLINAMQSYLVELESFDKKNRLLDMKGQQIKELEYELSKKQKSVVSEQEAVKQEKDYVIKTNKDLKEREIKLTEEKSHLSEINDAKVEYEERKQEALKQEAIVEEKLKLVEVINKKQLELDEKESLIEKANDIDAERKRLLDVREERIRAKEQRLKLDQME